MRRLIRTLAVAALIVTTLPLGGCTGNLGVGVSVGVPIGQHGSLSVGTSRWL